MLIYTHIIASNIAGYLYQKQFTPDDREYSEDGRYYFDHLCYNGRSIIKIFEDKISCNFDCDS